MNQHDGLWTVWTTLRSSELPTLPTAPTTATAMGWVLFRLSNGYFFNCQGSDETTQVGHFSIVKWVLFRLTNTEGRVCVGQRMEWDEEKM